MMRYLPLTDDDRSAMLGAIGVPSVEAFFEGVPESARLKEPLDLPSPAGEIEVERAIGALAAKNLGTAAAASFLGAGAYRHHIPAAVDYLIQRGEFLTSYTPYQPEVSQGTLQTLFEFQTQVALITGMEAANASMYDGASACGEAMLMAQRITRRSKAILSGALHPHYRAVAETLGSFAGTKTRALPPNPRQVEDLATEVDDETACVVVQNPDLFGRLAELSPLAEACQAAGALLVVAVAEVVSLGVLTPPGAMGADIVVAEGQSLGNPMSFGGPTVGLFACRERFVRQMPGRLCGQTVDAEGKRGFVLTMATREQHIRRERATSNICTNSGLCALAFTIHLALLGEEGFTRLAWLNHAKAAALAERLSSLAGIEIINSAFFNEFTLRLPKPAAEVVEALAAKRILAGVPVSRFYPEARELGDLLLVAATEMNTDEEMDALAAALEEIS